MAGLSPIRRVRLDDDHDDGRKVPGLSVLSWTESRSLKTLRPGSHHSYSGDRGSCVPLYGYPRILLGLAARVAGRAHLWVPACPGPRSREGEHEADVRDVQDRRGSAWRRTGGDPLAVDASRDPRDLKAGREAFPLS